MSLTAAQNRFTGFFGFSYFFMAGAIFAVTLRRL